MKPINKILTIAGSDSGGGAGIQADLKTFHALGVYGMSAITAVTAQNTVGVQGIYPLPVEAIVQQLDSIGTDLAPQAVKTGMLFNSELIAAIAERISHYGWTNVVVDPVMIAKGGAPLLQDEAIAALKSILMPLATVVTPNIPEAEIIADMRIESFAERQVAAKRIRQFGAKVVIIKGGHSDGEDKEAVDLLYDGEQFITLRGERIATKHTHGTGCTFAAALAAELGKGASIQEATYTAKQYIQCAIQQPLRIGSGHGPTNHWAYSNQGDTVHITVDRVR